MELQDLDTNEKTVLAAGLARAVLADDRATEREAAVVDRVARALGESEYQAAMDRADAQASDGPAFEALAATVTRSEARELIYGTLLEAAVSDPGSPGETSLLDGLARLWGLTVRLAGAGEDIQPLLR